MITKLGPIQPNPYGGHGEKKLNYLRGDDQYYCRIINGDQRIVVEKNWYEQWHVADIDPNEVNSKNRRDYIKEVLDNVDWDNLNNYPDSTLGVNLEQVITDQTGDAKIETYHYKLNRMKMAGLKFVWRGPAEDDVELRVTVADNLTQVQPVMLADKSGNTLATFDFELMAQRGFFLYGWWVNVSSPERPEVHVVITHESNATDEGEQ